MITKFCKDCGLELSVKDFYKNSTGIMGLQSYCKTHDKERSKKAKQKRRQSSLIRFEDYLRQEYNITLAWYFRLLFRQECHCAICKTDAPGRNKQHFSIDHNHLTGQIRGLLCHSCNTGLGLFYDKVQSLQNSINYLESKPLNLDNYKLINVNTIINKRSLQQFNRRFLKEFPTCNSFKEINYRKLLEIQNNKCAICFRVYNKQLHIDHDHTNGVIRGLLCGNCNRAIGLFKDDSNLIIEAIHYLQQRSKLCQMFQGFVRVPLQGNL